ncbi:MAG TPA: GNAT family N-acetyltransferase [Candidatus Saccharimonadales bacterium]|nr:GNAT family N-acetyltransferase [Candidatus Saccharimonadales bacterium]
MSDARPDFGIHTASLDEVGCVIDTLADGFLDGDLANWLIPDRPTRRTVYAEYFRIFAEFFLMHGQVDATEDVDAVALWWPVGDYIDMPIPDYDERLAKITGDAVGRFVMLDMTMHVHHPQFRPHHYLAFLAVQPDCQGQGIGGALLQHRLEQLDKEGVPAYLEATGIQTRTLYEHFGFRMTFPLDMPNGPTLVPMWRPGTYGLTGATDPR